MTEILSIYNKVRQEYGYMPELSPGCLDVQAKDHFSIDQYDGLVEKINGFNAEAGWLTLQSKNIRYKAGDDLAQWAEHGWILQGELISGNASLHIKPDGAGGWIVSEIVEANDDAEGLLEIVSFIAMPETKEDKEQGLDDLDKKQRLYYQVYWRKDESQGYRRELSRFTGFSAIEEGE